jgi:hypothetical protein
MRSIVTFLASLSVAVVAFAIAWVQFRPDLYSNFPPVDSGFLALGLAMAWAAVLLLWVFNNLLGVRVRTARRRRGMASRDRLRRAISGELL